MFSVKKVRFFRLLKIMKNESSPNLPQAIFKGSQICQKSKKNHRFLIKNGGFYGCGGRTRTYDLRVMSPTSCQLLYSAIWGAPLTLNKYSTERRVCQG